MSETQGYKISYETMLAARTAVYDRVVKLETILSGGGLDPFMVDYYRDQLTKARAAWTALGKL